MIHLLPLALLCLSLSVEGAREDWPELVLDERVLWISWVAANLSALAYATPTMVAEYAVTDPLSGDVTYEHPDYDWINFYTEEPDQAIVAKKDGRCYIAFRGTTLTIDDWLQNAGLGSRNIYKDNNVSDTSDEYCVVRGGFADFLFTDVVTQGRADVGECVSECESLDDCLVVTGHSQGGATATVAAITLYSLNPMIVTFGQPPTANPDCPYINNTQMYRYVNWLQDNGVDNDLGFDLVVYAPNWVSGSEHYGYNILVGEDPANAYFGGFGHDILFHPGISDLEVAAHTMSGANYSYESRVKNLYYSLPEVGVSGSVGGTICEDSYMDLCQSGSCVEFHCLPVGGITETCIKGSCEQDSDCAGDLVCIWDSCATGAGEVQEGCPCGLSSDCENNDCITLNLLTTDFICDDGRFDTNETCIPESCSSDENCLDGLVCIYGACATGDGEVEAGCPCRFSSQCENQKCITRNLLTLDFICDDGLTTDQNSTGTDAAFNIVGHLSWGTLAVFAWVLLCI